MTQELTDFAQDLYQEVLARSETADQESLREDEFTEVVIQYLVEAGELDDGFVCYSKMRGYKVNGYYISEDGDRLDLFVSDVFLDGTVHSLPKTRWETSLQRLKGFLERAVDGLYTKLEEASDAFDLAYAIDQAKNDLVRVRLYLLTDGTTKIEELPQEQVGDMEISYHVWDLTRLQQTVQSGRSPDRIIVDIKNFAEHPVYCLPAETSNKYRCYLAAFPAQVLVGMYAKYGPRLLERNVRSFLQARGNINKGIRKTVIDEPEMFLAYNNGLSVTCSGVTVEKDQNGHISLCNLADFQIVNGGQTTGSLFSTFKKDKKDLSKILVPVKITEIIDNVNVDDIAPKISMYANSQNKVNMADFSSNHPYHIKLQELSRTIYAPAPAGMQKLTRWYYERARGQYMDEKAREITPKGKKEFEARNPSAQKFTKTDLAKYENTWTQLPHIVSRGAQKNFLDFMQRLDKRGQFEPDERYFKQVIGKAILFKSTEKIVSAQHAGSGYRANVVTYTLAWLSHHTAQTIDLLKIWGNQSIDPVLRDAVETVCSKVFQIITSPPGGANITEWCKKESCWDKIRELEITLPTSFDIVLLKNERLDQATTVNNQPQGIEALTEDEKGLVDSIAQIPADTWFALSGWAKETDNLAPWQRGIAYSLGKVKARNGQPSIKQARQAQIILDEAKRLGFTDESTTPQAIQNA